MFIIQSMNDIMYNTTGTAICNDTDDVIDTTQAIGYSSTTPTYQPPFNITGIVICSIIIFIFLLIGVFANSLTMAVILSYKELNRNVFMRFILSLCVSDIISALVSWIFLYRRTWGFEDWGRIPTFFCKLYWAVDITTSYVTALHILSFAILRLLSIQKPLFYKKIKLLHGNIWLGLIWFVCICSGIVPCFFIFGVGKIDRNSREPRSRWPVCTAQEDKFKEYELYQRIAYPIFFYGPTIGVVVTCTAVVLLVAVKSRHVATSLSEEKRNRKEKKAVIQLLLIILSFLIGFIPFTAYEFWSVQCHPKQPYYAVVDYWFGMIGYFFLRFSECLNPLFYNLGSPKVYKHTKRFVKTKLCSFCIPIFKNKFCCEALFRDTVESSGTSSISDQQPTRRTPLPVRKVPVAFTPVLRKNNPVT